MLRLMTGCVCAAALAAIAACVPSAQAGLLFLDNYSVGQNVNGTAGPTTYDAAARQTGTVAPQDYTATFYNDVSWQLQLGNSDRPGALLLAPDQSLGAGSKAVTVSPNHDFREAVGSTNSYTISVQMDPNALTASGDSYMYLAIGNSSQTAGIGVNDGLSAGVRKDGSWFLFDNTRGNVSNTSGQLTPHTGFYTVEFTYTVPAFDKATQLPYSLSIDGQKVWGDTLSSGGITNNYVMLSAVNSQDSTGVAIGWFDNLTVQANTIPEPASLFTLATGIIGLLAYAWRKRK